MVVAIHILFWKTYVNEYYDRKMWMKSTKFKILLVNVITSLNYNDLEFQEWNWNSMNLINSLNY